MAFLLLHIFTCHQSTFTFVNLEPHDFHKPSPVTSLCTFCKCVLVRWPLIPLWLGITLLPIGQVYSITFISSSWNSLFYLYLWAYLQLLQGTLAACMLGILLCVSSDFFLFFLFFLFLSKNQITFPTVWCLTIVCDLRNFSVIICFCIQSSQYHFPFYVFLAFSTHYLVVSFFDKCSAIKFHIHNIRCLCFISNSPKWFTVCSMNFQCHSSDFNHNKGLILSDKVWSQCNDKHTRVHLLQEEGLMLWLILCFFFSVVFIQKLLQIWHSWNLIYVCCCFVHLKYFCMP